MGCSGDGWMDVPHFNSYIRNSVHLYAAITSYFARGDSMFTFTAYTTLFYRIVPGIESKYITVKKLSDTNLVWLMPIVFSSI
jgi:hypothetical protein